MPASRVDTFTRCTRTFDRKRVWTAVGTEPVDCFSTLLLTRRCMKTLSFRTIRSPLRRWTSVGHLRTSATNCAVFFTSNVSRRAERERARAGYPEVGAYSATATTCPTRLPQTPPGIRGRTGHRKAMKASARRHAAQHFLIQE